MVRRLGRLLVLAVCVNLLSGCWSRHELNELAIVVGMGIDKVGDQYKVSVQIVNPGQVSTRNGMSSVLQPVVTYVKSGATVPEAIRKMTVQSSKRLYFSHLRIIVFGEKLAREGISKPIDYISRDSEMRNDFFLVVAKGATPHEVLSTFSTMDPIPANNLYNKLYNSDDLWAGTGKITLDRLTMDLMSSGKNASMSAIRITGNKMLGNNMGSTKTITPGSTLEYTGMAAFRGDKMVGWLDGDETKALNYLQDSVHQTVGVVDCPDGGHVSLAVTGSNTTVRVGRDGDMPVINATIRVDQNISDVECDMDMSKMESLDILRQSGQKKLAELLEKGIKRAQKDLRTDIFGFGKEVHQQQPALWHRIKDWNEVFPDIKVHVYPLVIIRKMGTIAQPIQSQTKGE